jgi:mannose-6-phosphate isomerase-like protein (cupin superfamily)
MIITSTSAENFQQGGTSVVGYASPSRGATQLSLWRVSLAPGETSPPHTLSREEVFLALAGSAVATIDGVPLPLSQDDCLIVPPDVPFVLEAGAHGLDAVCAMTVGGQATILPDGPTMTPPWAA